MLQQQRQQSQTRVRPCQGLKPGHDTCPGYASVRMYVWFTSQVVVNLCALLREQRSALERCVLLQLYTSAALCEPPKTRGTVALHAAYSTSSAIVDEVHLLPALTFHHHGQPRVGDAGRESLCNPKQHLITVLDDCTAPEPSKECTLAHRIAVELCDDRVTENARHQRENLALIVHRRILPEQPEVRFDRPPLPDREILVTQVVPDLVHFGVVRLHCALRCHEPRCDCSCDPREQHGAEEHCEALPMARVREHWRIAAVSSVQGTPVSSQARYYLSVDGSGSPSTKVIDWKGLTEPTFSRSVCATTSPKPTVLIVMIAQYNDVI